MLERLPLEILNRILTECDPIDIASFSQSCRLTRDHVYGEENQTHLWHLIFLNHFDPSICSINQKPVMGRDGEVEGEEGLTKKQSSSSGLNLQTNIDWRQSVQRRIRLRQTLSCSDDKELMRRLEKNYPGPKLIEIYQEIFELMRTSRIDCPKSFLSGSKTKSLNITFLQNILSHPPTQFRIIHYSGQNSQYQPLFALRQTLEDKLVSAAAELHAKYGLTAFDQSRPRTRGIARESCYALPNYHSGSLYGPFMPDRSCRVNWAHLEALSVVVGLNLSHTKPIGTNEEEEEEEEEEDDDDDDDDVVDDDPNFGDGRPRPSTSRPTDRNASSSPNTTATPTTTTATSEEPIVASTSNNNNDNGDDPELLLNPEISSDSPNMGRQRSFFDVLWPILEGLVAARPFTQITNPAYQHVAYDWPPNGPKVERPIDLNHYDWAGVEGKWLRAVCFLDYRDLHAYNFSAGSQRPKLDSFNEATRLMTLNLKVISIGERPVSDPTHPQPLSIQDGPSDRPPIYFRGTSSFAKLKRSNRSFRATSSVVVGNPTAQVRGCVSMSKDGEVRWSVVSTAAGQDRWSSEGIQVGGIRSRWGVVGVWTDVDRTDVEGPAGPFYFFKTSY